MSTKVAKADLSLLNRRGFLHDGSLLVTAVSLAGLSGLVVSCEYDGEEESVSPNEDLMREHGLLQRLLLIYDAAVSSQNLGQVIDPDNIHRTAVIIRDFIEGYHEKLEEDYLFPRLEKAGRLTDLVSILKRQHEGGRKLTGMILTISGKNSALDSVESQKMAAYLTAFNRMYLPHMAREDTILFPAFKHVISSHEYDALGEEFEKVEHEKFGEEGFEGMVEKVAGIEKSLGLYDLDHFTPEMPG